MQLIQLPTHLIQVPEWNPNRMDEGTRPKLLGSIDRFGLVVPLVVRPVSGGRYETVGGAQRLGALRELEHIEVPCVIVQVDDTEARLLAQALNRIQGQDDLGLRAEAIRNILETMPREEVLAILPETADSLDALLALGEADLAQHLQAWQRAQSALLRHLTFQLVQSQLEVVEEALKRAIGGAADNADNPNKRGNAMFDVCKSYLSNLGADR